MFWANQWYVVYGCVQKTLPRALIISFWVSFLFRKRFAKLIFIRFKSTWTMFHFKWNVFLIYWQILGNRFWKIQEIVKPISNRGFENCWFSWLLHQIRKLIVVVSSGKVAFVKAAFVKMQRILFAISFSMFSGVSPANGGYFTKVPFHEFQGEMLKSPIAVRNELESCIRCDHAVARMLVV